MVKEIIKDIDSSDTDDIVDIGEVKSQEHKVQIDADELPEITILTPVFKRNNFLPLWLMNLKHQQYPSDKIKVIVDECESDELFIDNLYHVKAMLYPIKVEHNVYKDRKTIGEKRNRLVESCKTEFFCFMDSDDMYQPNYLIYSFYMMRENKVDAVASPQMIFTFPFNKENPYQMAFATGPNMKPHESTLMMTKELFSRSAKFAETSQGEGNQLWESIKDNIYHTDVINCMMCICHKDNTVPKEHFLTDKTKCDDAKIDEGLKEFLDNILRISRDKPSEEEESKTEDKE
tara:strand:- start:5975 stop:6841 length:867 start_codon:yes stop_codon:yes gene_type:complete